MTELLIIGAGPAGLTAALRAASRGHQVRVLERAVHAGGMARSIEVGGQRVDLGSHRLHPSTPPHLLAVIRSLLGDDLQVRPRRGRLLLRGRWLAFPLRAADIVRRMPPGFALAAGFDAITGPFRHAREDTFAEVVRERFGPAVLREFYGPYAQKLWGLPASELAGELARRRIAAAGAGAIARKIARAARPEGRTFLYPRLGYGQIVERLADAAVAAGAAIELGARITQVDARPDGVSVSLSDARGDRSVGAERVLWTAPLTGLVDVSRHAPARVVQAASSLWHRAMVLVYLVLDQPRYTEFDAHYLPDAALAVARLSEPKNYRDGPDPRDRTVLCAEIPCAEGDGTWTADAGRLAGMVVETLAAAGLPPARPIDVAVHRLPRVYPVYGRETGVALAAVDAWARSLSRVTVFGRQGSFVADNLHHVMAMGWDAASAIGPDGTWDVAAWDEARRRHAAHVVED
jgi:protoporphyrinogen oxidase